MKNGNTRSKTVLVVAGLILANSAYAFNFGNMMNPSKWMDNKDDDYYGDEYYGGPGGYGPPPGYYPPPGYAPGYGAPGYAAPGYGGAYTAPAPAQRYAPDQNLPETHSSYEYNRDKEEIARLKERIRKLEESRPQPPSPPAYGGGTYGGSQPTYQQSAPSAYGSPQATPQMSTQPAWGNQPQQQYQYQPQQQYRYRQE